MSSPKVSVVVPVYNDAEYLNQCMESIINQTLKEIEIICVDDCSTDDSLKILKEYAEIDSRIKIYCFDNSQSALAARKKGVMESSGDYIMFSDSDDFMSEDACELAYKKITETKVDILQFSSKVINCANISEDDIKHLNEKRLKPYPERLKDDAVLKECFINDKYSFTLWNKIFDAKLCKIAFADIEDKYMPKAQDLYTYFLLAYHAKTYFGWESKPLYNYCYGRGVTGGNDFNLNKFERCCLQSRVADALERFCEDKENMEDCANIVRRYRNNWKEFCINTWKEHLGREDASLGLNMLFENWGIKETVLSFINKYSGNQDKFAKKLGRFNNIELKNKKIKTVALYYSRYSVGGTEKVMSLLMPEFIKMGYNVVLITEEHPSENDFPLPPQVTRVILAKEDSSGFKNRLDSWETIIDENKIDIVLYNAWGSKRLLWDLLYLKGKNVSVISQAHSVFSYRLMSFDPRFFSLTPVYALLDGVVVLSNVDKLFWEAFNKNTYYIPNPVSKELFNVKQVNWDNKAVIWIGRTTYEKNPHAPFEIMQKVAAEVPDAKLYLLGDFDDSKWKETAKKYGVEDNIIFTGFVSDVNKYLAKASVHLMTSSFEGFPMSLLEAKAHGMPTVMFDMPHLELGTEKRGTIGVDMMDCTAAANEIVSLLQSEEHWNEISKNAVSCTEEFKNYDYKSAWKNVFDGITPKKSGNDLTDDMVHTIINHYELGYNFKNKNKKPADKSLKQQVDAAIKCAKEKGVVYTVKLFFKKLV